LNNKGFREESMTKVELDAIGTSMTLESNKSQRYNKDEEVNHERPIAT
jgi:hypothetical protein